MHPTRRHRRLTEAAIVLGTAPWLWLTLRPGRARERIDLVPLHDLTAVVAAGDGVVQIVGNLAVLATFGFFLPVRFALGSGPIVLLRVAAFAAAVSIGIELVQLLIPMGRVTAIDDVLLNTLGAVLAATLSRRWWRRGALGRSGS